MAATEQENRIAALTVSEIVPSRTNRAIDKDALNELTESVRSKGVLSPIMVRPVNGKHEVVFGERRLLAAKAAGLDTIPAIIRALTDVEAVEAQIIENCQRQDVHPMEEAESYRRLHEEHGYHAEDIAAKIGKSKAYVYARMKLSDLAKPAKKAFVSGKLSASVALLIARMPRQLQESATKDITHHTYHPSYKGKRVARDEPLSFRAASVLLQRDYMLRLSEATFPTDSPELVPAAGACTTCPKRTGNQRELFDDVKSADVCTDPECFRSKRDAQWERVKTDAQGMGYEILSDAKTKKVFPSSVFADKTAFGSDYVALEQSCRAPNTPAHGKAYVALLRKEIKAGELPVVLARDNAGKIRKLLPEKAANKLLRKAGLLKKPKSASSSTAASSAKDKSAAAENKQCKLRRKTTRKTLAAIAAAVEKPLSAAKTREVWRQVAKLAHEIAQYDGAPFVLERRQIPGRAVDVRIQRAKEGELRGLALELLLAEAHVELVEDGWMPPGRGYPATLLGAAKAVGVDVKAIHQELAAADTAAPSATKKKSPASGRNGRKK